MDTQTTSTPDVRRRLRLVRVTLGVTRHWLLIFIVLLGVLNVLPFVAPVSMRLGWRPIGETIYTLYSTMCHQMAQRSFFLFGPQTMYNIDQLPLDLSGSTLSQQLELRLFTGAAETGWKVAWSDRMVYLYGSLWIASVLYGFLSRCATKPIRCGSSQSSCCL
jgi:hypothetical protein